MSHTLTANTARSNVNTALVAGIAQPYTPKAFPTLTFGETVDITLYLVTEGGAIDARSGATGYTPRISVMLPTLAPTSGTFTISDSSDAYVVSGAGTSDVNGEYVRNGDSSNGNPAYTLYDSDGTTAKYNMWSFAGAWSITSSGIGSSGPDGFLYFTLSSATTPPESGWESLGEGEDPAPTLAIAGETVELEYNASESEIESELNAMNSDTGPFGDLVTVTKFADGTFSIRFDSVGAQTELTVSASGIQPTSAASVLPLVEGDATTREEQLIRILADPLVFEDSAAQIFNGWTMTLDADNAKILRATAAEQGAISANYKIEIVNADSTADVVAQGPVIING